MWMFCQEGLELGMNPGFKDTLKSEIVAVFADRLTFSED